MGRDKADERPGDLVTLRQRGIGLVRGFPLPSLAAALSLIIASPRLAGAEGESATAQALFDEAKNLVAAGKYAEACPKLEESQRLDPGIGTLLNLADCYERDHKIASAWSKFLEAATSAKMAGQGEREHAAHDRAAALAPHLSKILVTVSAAADVPGLEVKRDGVAVGKAQWGLAIPADQGLHRVSASAPGYGPWETKVLVKGSGDLQSIAVPPLQAGMGSAPGSATTNAAIPASPAPSSPPPPSEASEGPNSQRVLALGAAGVGVVGVALGTIWGLTSKNKHDEAAQLCNGSDCYSQPGVDAKTAAVKNGNLSTAAFIVGSVGLVGGAVLWLTAAPSSKQKTSTALLLGPGTVELKETW